MMVAFVARPNLTSLPSTLMHVLAKISLLAELPAVPVV